MKWILFVIGLLLVTGCHEKKIVENENNQKVDREENNVLETNPPIEISNTEESTNIPKLPENSIVESNPNIEVSNVGESVENQEPQMPDTPALTKEEQSMQAIATLEQEVNTLLDQEQTESLKEKIATKFITLVDFIYYDEPIGNVYFKDLTASAQEKVRSILARMDTAIESKIPNYKDTLKEKYQKVLNYIKTGVGNLTNKASEKMESVMGSENYQNFVDAKDDMVESFQNTGKLIKDGASHIYQS